MIVESVCCGATHCATRSSLLELLGCGAIALAAVVVIQELVGRNERVEGIHAP